MRSLFIVGAKLLGVWAVLLVLQNVPVIAGFVVGAAVEGLNRGEWGALLMVLPWSAWAAGLIVTGNFLLLKTERIAVRVKVAETELSGRVPSTDELLRLGIVLIGVLTIVSSLAKLGTGVAVLARVLLGEEYRQAGMQGMGMSQIRTILYGVLPVAGGLVCMLRPGWIVAAIERWSKKSERGEEEGSQEAAEEA